MSESPSPISRPIFVNALSFRGGALTVENLDHGTAYALAAAGLGHQDLVELAGPDGRVAGRAEWGTLFDRLDAGRAGVLTGEEPTTAAEALRDEVDRRRLAACGGHGIVHLALRPEGAIEARALGA